MQDALLEPYGGEILGLEFEGAEVDGLCEAERGEEEEGGDQ